MHLGTRSLTLRVDGLERTADVSDCRIEAVEADTAGRTLFGDTLTFRLRGVAAQDMAADSLWALAWEATAGTVEADIRPAGGAVPTEEQPWFLGTLQIDAAPGVLVGGPADPALGGRFTFEFDWAFLAKPERIDGTRPW
ncbi:hypothetical protein [Nocardioides bruguierae]|uniref:Uncharacterized protein n=1 Tax=Nocardioides bruguierae TaxID=2945102 RepID=A0A9X2D3Q9_9ACTN|nr:hypothetical protein [Nocardioides bruguierae]MCM0618776.1 hypothetical protein [Nocardioides bruguierae]